MIFSCLTPSLRPSLYLPPPHLNGNFSLSWCRCGSTVGLLVITLLLLLLVVLTGLRRHLTVSCGSHEGGHDVYGNWEHDGAVVLSRDAVQSLEISQLQGRGTVHDDLGCLS